jgi:hypothetical protein
MYQKNTNVLIFTALIFSGVSIFAMDNVSIGVKKGWTFKKGIENCKQGFSAFFDLLLKANKAPRDNSSIIQNYNRRQITAEMLQAQRAQLNAVNHNAPVVEQLPDYEGVAELFVEPVVNPVDRAIDLVADPVIPAASVFKSARTMQVMYGAAAVAAIAGALRYGPTVATAVKVKTNALSKFVKVEYLKAKLVLGDKLDTIKRKYRKSRVA